MIALVTGATGFIGSHLTQSLLQKGFKVRALIRKTSNLQWLKETGIEQVVGDLSEGSLPAGVFTGVNYIFHLSGVIEALSREDYFKVNTGGTRRLLEAAAQNSPSLKKFVFVSSQAAGGPSRQKEGVREEDPPHPVSHYGESKLAAEKEVLGFARLFPTVILRPPTIYGPREMRVFRAFQMMKRGFALAPGFKPKFISFCYVTDLVEAVFLAAFQDQPSGRIYNVAGPRSYEWLEFIDTIGRALNRSYRVYRIPASFLSLLGAVGEIYSRLSRRTALFTRQKVKEFVQNSWVIDGSRIREELGWSEKTTLQEGLIQTAAWYHSEGWL